MTASVTSKDASGKKIKIYVDEDLDIEHKMIQYRMRERKEDPTKGPEISNYFLFCIHFLGWVSWRLCKVGSLLDFWEIV